MPALPPSQFIERAQEKGYLFSLHGGDRLGVKPPPGGSLTDPMRRYIGVMKAGLLEALREGPASDKATDAGGVPKNVRFCPIDDTLTPTENPQNQQKALNTGDLRGLTGTSKSWGLKPGDAPLVLADGRVVYPPDDPRHWEPGGIFHPTTTDRLRSIMAAIGSGQADGLTWRRSPGVTVPDLKRWLKIRLDSAERLDAAAGPDGLLWCDTGVGRRIAADILDLCSWWSGQWAASVAREELAARQTLPTEDRDVRFAKVER